MPTFPFFNLKFIVVVSRLFFFKAIIESDDLKAVINEMDKAFNYSQKVSKMNSSLHISGDICSMVGHVRKKRFK